MEAFRISLSKTSVQRLKDIARDRKETNEMTELQKLQIYGKEYSKVKLIEYFKTVKQCNNGGLNLTANKLGDTIENLNVKVITQIKRYMKEMNKKGKHKYN